MTNTPITYCTNIHPGESWEELLLNLNKHVLYIKERFAPDKPFPLGLRLSASAVNDLSYSQIEHFAAWCEEYNCFPLTLNGFPYGDFHGTSVKEAVYQPDWRSERRVDYSCKLADFLALCATKISSCEKQNFSISTVPIGYKLDFNTEHWPLVQQNLIHTLQYFEKIHDNTGVKILLALEPEPCCVLEETAELTHFFEQMNFPGKLREYIGICLDCCHQAVEYETPKEIISELHRANVTIAKVQVSSALRASTPSEIDYLSRFHEPTYLHQAVVRMQDGRLLRFSDLPEMQNYLINNVTASESRVHFHVPIFLEHLGEVGTTREFIEDLLPLLPSAVPLEVETYSFSVLPPHLQLDSVDDSILRELTWLKELLNAPNGCA